MTMPSSANSVTIPRWPRSTSGQRSPIQTSPACSSWRSASWRKRMACPPSRGVRRSSERASIERFHRKATPGYPRSLPSCGAWGWHSRSNPAASRLHHIGAYGSCGESRARRALPGRRDRNRRLRRLHPAAPPPPAARARHQLAWPPGGAHANPRIREPMPATKATRRPSPRGAFVQAGRSLSQPAKHGRSARP